MQTKGGETTVAVGQDAQRASGITVAPIAASTIRSQYTAYATVVDPQPLFDLRARLAGAQADLGTLTVQAGNSSAQYRRSLSLYDDDRNVSLKALQDARAAMQADEAKLQSARAALQSLLATANAQYGEVLSRAAAAHDAKLLSDIQAGHASIVRITLPTAAGTDAPDRLTVGGTDGQTVAAQKLSASPIADPAVQGRPWFYAAHPALPVGTRTTVNVPTSQAGTPALLIPQDAIVWYGGQTWAYVRIAPNRFARRYVPSSHESDAGFFVTSGFHEGDLVVTHGAQLLLSQELKPQGIATACKDPPECDD